MPTSKPISKEDLEDILLHCIDGGFIHDLFKPPLDLSSDADMQAMYWTPGDNNDPEVTSGRNYLRFWKVMDALNTLKPKMITHFMFNWDDWEWPTMSRRMRSCAQIVKSFLPDVVLQANPVEYLDSGVLGSVNATFGTGGVPHWVTDAFGLPPLGRNFELDQMRFPDYPDQFGNPDHGWYEGNLGADRIVPDIHRQETQLWFYFLGRTYIDMGCEAIDFNRIDLMNGMPINNPAIYNDWESGDYWDAVISRLRIYAESKPNTYINNATERIRYLLVHAGPYKRTGTHELISDYINSPIRPIEIPGGQLDQNGGGCAVKLDVCGSLLRKTVGGRTPSGWYCTHLPNITLLDKYGTDPNNNPHVFHPYNPGSCFYPFFWDEITWFATRPEQYRNDWIPYAYYKVRCLDRNSFFTMPFSKCVWLNILIGSTFNNREARYYAVDHDWPTVGQDNVTIPALFPAVPVHNDTHAPDTAAIGLDPANYYLGYNNMSAIKNVLDGVDTPAKNWVIRDFNDQDVFAVPVSKNVRSDLIFVGNDKMFFIGEDHRIHGFVKSSNYPGVWVTVSPSYSAQDNYNIPVWQQGAAKSNLVASPDGSRLLYIGWDGLVHGFDVVNIWTYSYFRLRPERFPQQQINADSSLIYPTNERVYYLGRHYNESGQPLRVHGFIKTGNTWETVSPAYAAQGQYGQSVQSQSEPLGSLTYDGDKLYFRDVIGRLRMYNIYNDWSYWYNDISGANSYLAGSLRIVGDIRIHANRIFFIAEEQWGTKQVRIYILEGTQTGWNLINPTAGAQSLGGGDPVPWQSQPEVGWGIALSPDGRTVAYSGVDGKVYYYVDQQNVNHPNDFRHYSMRATDVVILNSLQFHNGEIFGVYPDFGYDVGLGQYAEQSLMSRLYCYKWETDYCSSPFINLVEKVWPNMKGGKWYNPEPDRGWIIPRR